MTYGYTPRQERIAGMRSSIYARYLHSTEPRRNVALAILHAPVAAAILRTADDTAGARAYALNTNRRKKTKGIFGRLLARHKTTEISVQELIDEIEEGDFAFDESSAFAPLIREHLANFIIYTYCEHCDRIDLRSDDEDCVDTNEVNGETWCDSCCNEYANHSEAMDCYICSEDAVQYYATPVQFRDRDTRYNYDVVTRDWADNNAYFRTDGDDDSYCVSADVMEAYPERFDPDYNEFDEDEDEDEDEDGAGRNSGGICSYHQSNPQRIGNGAADGVNMGVELEIVSKNNDRDDVLSFVNAVQAALGSSYYCGFERDGSLEGITTGVEMVTGYGSLDAHREHLATILTDDEVSSILDDLTADDSCCGMHIHISANKMTPIHRIKLDAFTLAPANRPTWLKVAGRSGNTYAQYIVANSESPLPNTQPTKLAAQLAKAARLETDARPRAWYSQNKSLALEARTAHWSRRFERYRVINWQKGQTAEFRMFQGTVDYATIIARLELVRGLYAFTKVTPITCLTWDCFFAWAEQPTNICDLRGFLTWAAKKGIVTAKDFYKPRLRSWAKPHPVVASKPEPPPPPSREEAEAAAVARLREMGVVSNAHITARPYDAVAIRAADLSAAIVAVNVPFTMTPQLPRPAPAPAWPFEGSTPHMAPAQVAIWRNQALSTQFVHPPLPNYHTGDADRYALTEAAAPVHTPTMTSGAFSPLDY